MKILLIDNFDSFTFNLYQFIGEILEDLFPGSIVDVLRNNELSAQEIRHRNYDRIIISPGPGNPADTKYFGICKDVIIDLAKSTPTLGICLGLQGIAHFYGGKVVKASLPMHGKTSAITHIGVGIFRNIPSELKVMRYHSLIVDFDSIPSCLEITAIVVKSDKTGEVMGLRHKQYPLEGVQFHPESFGSEFGKQLLINFLEQK